MDAVLSPQAAAVRAELLQATPLDPVRLDRIALALAIPSPGGLPPQPRGTVLSSTWEELEDLDGGGVLEAALVVHGLSLNTATLAALLHRGYELLGQQWAEAGQRWSALVRAWQGAAGLSPSTETTGLIRLELGRLEDDQAVCWDLNHETSNANARIAGAPGAGKTQFLMHLLARLAAASPGTGVLLLDYKGDLSDNPRFLEAARLRVIRPQEAPLPINPFQLPEGVDSRLAPRAFAEVFASVSSARLGPVQRELLTRAMERAYAQARHQDLGYPSLDQVRQAVLQVYEEEGRAIDSVISDLRALADLDLFSQRSELTHEATLRQRWVLDLSGLGSLRDYVAFVFLEYLHQAAQGLADSAFDGVTHTRELRGVIAVDEAHYYLAKRCQPLLRLIRIGRSKGIPVVLASQSLSDFKAHTELAELLPHTFLLKHGLPQEPKLLAGALSIPLDQARRVASHLTQLEQFHAFYAAARGAGEGGPPVIRLHPFFESHP